ncbi:hypothetical protein [Liquorilactobacillus nagelii]|uniref:hypothetical protein n=1 Tax=Liquorilactobacillus nagelii TaxID=82688 RepID=UPI0039E93F2B
MMGYEVGDKVVVEITEVDEKDKELTYGVGNPTWIRSKYILGKLSDFTKPKKIRFSKAEKKEFDDVFNALNTPWAILTRIEEQSGYYPNLYKRLFQTPTASKQSQSESQSEFVRVIEHPELIEVVKEKKYYIRILGQYLVHSANQKMGIELVSKEYADPFSLEQIREMNKWEKFKEIDLEKCKEAVKDE